MASLYIKDPDTAGRVATIARQLGTTKTEALRRALDALEATFPTSVSNRPSFGEKMEKWRRDNPPLPPTGLTADKAFSDWLSGEEDVVDPFR